MDQIEDNAVQSEILLKFLSIKYNDNPLNWDMKQIRQIEKAYDKVLKNIS